MNKTIVKLIIAFTAFCLLLLSIWVIRLTWSEILTIRPQKVLGQLTKSSKSEPVLAKKMILRLERSISLNSESANSHFILAQYYEYLYADDLKTERENYLLLAESEYKKALYLQPTWELAWSKLASLYDKLNDKNKMLHCLQQAIFIGPYEDNTQKIIFPLILKHWELIGTSEKNVKQISKILTHIFRFKKHHNLTVKYALNSQNPVLMKVVEQITPNKKHKDQLKNNHLKFNKANVKQEITQGKLSE